MCPGTYDSGAALRAAAHGQAGGLEAGDDGGEHLLADAVLPRQVTEVPGGLRRRARGTGTP